MVNKMIKRSDFNRAAKILVDRDGITPLQAEKVLANKTIVLCIGSGVEDSPNLQSAIITAANIAKRCFIGNVEVELPNRDIALAIPFPGATTLAEALQCLSVDAGKMTRDSRNISFGTFNSPSSSIAVEVDGWIASVGPSHNRMRLLGREYNPLAGALAGALAVSEQFLSLTSVSVQACRREVGISLWRPDLDWRDSESSGIPLEYLPNEAWFLGLGHLGQAMLWCWTQLPFSQPRQVNLVLNDFDHVVPANQGTGLLTFPHHDGMLKTRVCSEWVESVGFKPRFVERKFEGSMNRDDSEPSLAFCGFDGSGPRHELEDFGFELVAESGLGGRFDNFDEISCHVFPNDSFNARESWDLQAGEQQEESTVLKNRFYHSVKQTLGCGHMELAGVSVAVPFVGVAAGALALAEPLRILNGGMSFASTWLRLEDPDSKSCHIASRKRAAISSQPASPISTEP